MSMEHFNVEDFVASLNGLDRQERSRLAKEALNKVNTELDSIKAQLLTAKAKVWAGGGYSDPQWYAKAQIALQIRVRQIQKLQTLIGNIRREPTPSKPSPELKAFHLFFYKAARDILSQAEFKTICSRAEELEEREREK